MPLSLSELAQDPFIVFDRWFKHAKESSIIREPTKMCLSTRDLDGFPASRWVLMKYYDNHIIRFYTNYQSAKGQQLARDPHVAVNFLWEYSDYFRQVRVQGIVKETQPEIADKYFATRTRESQLSAWASKQSLELDSRQKLLDRKEKFANKFEGKEVPRPPFWSGYDIVPSFFEFWQTGEHRLHDRFQYKLQPNGLKWDRNRRYP